MSERTADVLLIVALAAVSIGAGLFHPGAGLILAGLGLAWIVWVSETPPPSDDDSGRFDALRTASPSEESR